MSKFKVSSVGKFGSLQFRFKVKEQELLDKGISRNDLKLYSGLNEYSLQLLKVDHGYIYYVVTVPTMGKFVLGRVGVNPPDDGTEQGPIPDDSLPGSDVAVQTGQKVGPTQDSVDSAGKREGLAGKAAELPVEGSESKGLWSRIVDFFRNLFS